MQFQISREFIEKIEKLVENKNNKELLVQFENMHHADIAETLEEGFKVAISDSEKKIIRKAKISVYVKEL